MVKVTVMNSLAHTAVAPTPSWIVHTATGLPCVHFPAPSDKRVHDAQRTHASGSPPTPLYRELPPTCIHRASRTHPPLKTEKCTQKRPATVCTIQPGCWHHGRACQTGNQLQNGGLPLVDSPLPPPCGPNQPKVSNAQCRE